MTDRQIVRIDAGTIVTVDSEHRILKDHSVLMQGATILAIVETGEAAKFNATQTYELPNHVLMPGLINAHGHAAMTLLRGIANDLPLQEWLEKHIWPTEAANVDSDFVSFGTKLAVAEMIRSGTTTFSDMYFFPEDAARQVDQLGMRAQLCCPILDFPTAWGNGPDEYLDKSEELFKRYQNHPLIDIALGPHAPYTVSDGPLTKVCELASKHGMSIQMHIHETQQEVDDAVAHQGKRPLLRLDELGLFDLDIPIQAVHMTSLNEHEINLLASKKVNVIHCPESNMKLASGFCPTHELHKAGVNVALGTDGAASNNDLDMFGEMRTAALIAKGYTGNASAISARDAIAMATINGAKAMGIDGYTGSLEKGKQADMIALDLDRLYTAPSFNIEADIVYNLNSQQVTHSWVAGELLLDCGRLTRIDEKQLIQHAKEWSVKIKNSN